MRLAFPGLMAALAEKVTVVTPTPTLAAIASEQFSRAQLSSGTASWERPKIQSMDAWMSGCWQDARFETPNAPSLLSPLQERELWRQIIAADRPDLFDLRAMASLAQRASRVIAEYQIPTEGEAWVQHADAQEFLRWHQALQSRLRAENWITRSDLWRLLPAWIKGSVAFVGLTSISPGLKSLSRALGNSVQSIGITYSTQPAMASAIPFESVSQEQETVARRVRYLLETEKTNSIGILVADLPAHARDLTRRLHEVLYPSTAAGDHFHMQTGAWRENPLISNALLLLELVQPRVNHASAGAILRSPFIDGYPKERSERAFADHKLHRARELDFSILEIEKAVWDCSILYQILRRITKIADKATSFQRLSAWSEVFNDIIEAAKWPAIEHPTEAEQQAVDQWNKGLSALASLGLVSPPVTLNQALSHLRAILNRPSELGNWSSPIQVLDAGLSEGIEFDHSFVVNASEDGWPTPFALSPLIPYHLQRLYQVPASRPESVAEERERKTKALVTSASKVQVSYTGNLTPLLRDFVRVASGKEISVWSGETASQTHCAAELDSRNDSHAPVLLQAEGVRGGAGIIKAQSLCPFKAFAEYRLNARGEDDASIGFDALERGECVHKALEYVWRELGSQRNLKALPAEDLKALVEKHVEQAVEEDEADGPIRALTSLAERDRLVLVLLHWLQIEKDRSMPFVVEKLEEKREAELAGLKLSLRMDRVDRLANGSLVLIDYKSGAQVASKLAGDRPREPQLLVYAAALNEPVDGFYFGELRNRRVRSVGHGADKHFPRQRGTEEHPQDWDRFLGDSRDAVHRLASEFLQGEAGVAPQAGACAYCKIKPICRVASSAVIADDAE